MHVFPALTTTSSLVIMLSVCGVGLIGCAEDPHVAGAPTARYDTATGRLERLEFDSTSNGRRDAAGIMNGTRVERIEVDENEDGLVDRWEFYDATRRLVKVGYSRRGNGIADATAFYGADGAIARIEISTRGDGSFNRIEHYRSGSLARVEEDTNGDGRPDKWESYAVPADDAPGSSWVVTAAFDDRFRGSANRRFVYRRDGSVLRVEVDPDGDGTFTDAAAPPPRP